MFSVAAQQRLRLRVGHGRRLVVVAVAAVVVALAVGRAPAHAAAARAAALRLHLPQLARRPALAPMAILHHHLTLRVSRDLPCTVFSYRCAQTRRYEVLLWNVVVLVANSSSRI